ncbi:glutaredoxin [Auriculariales sp. MPI-PUGE-AT-0066]|nr:glutaredoxin [Auriculariales sp. MPI-PUGE-AT-0066]
MMLGQIGGFIRGALRKRSTYLFLLLVVFLLVMVPVVRVPGDESEAGDVGELHALVYALQKAQAAGKASVSLPDASNNRAWARAAGEDDVTAWRKAAKRTFKQSPVVVFSKSYCPYSRRAKELLASFSLDPAPLIFELDLREDGREIQDLLFTLTGRGTVPNVIVGGQSIGGADDIAALHAAGRLEPILNQAILAARRPRS